MTESYNAWKRSVINDIRFTLNHLRKQSVIINMDGSDRSYADALLYSEAIGVNNVVCVVTPNPHWDWEVASQFVEDLGAELVVVPTTLVIADMINQIKESGEHLSDAAILKLSSEIGDVVTRTIRADIPGYVFGNAVRDIIDLEHNYIFYKRYVKEVCPNGRNNQPDC